MYDEERDEEQRDFHVMTRDLWNPDGKSAPPEDPELTSIKEDAILQPVGETNASRT